MTRRKMDNTPFWARPMVDTLAIVVRAIRFFNYYVLILTAVLIDMVAFIWANNNPFYAPGLWWEDVHELNIEFRGEFVPIEPMDDLFEYYEAATFSLDFLELALLTILGFCALPGVVTVFWIGAFIVIFNTTSLIEVSNEALLLFVMIVAIFLVHPRLSPVMQAVTNSYSAVVQDSIQSSVSRVSEAATYHGDAELEWHTGTDATEELLAVAGVGLEDSVEADDVLVEQALVAVVTQLLQDVAIEEVIEDAADEVAEEFEVVEETLNEVLDGLEADFGDEEEEEGIDSTHVYC